MDKMNDKIIVYTAITGNYDTLKEPERFAGCDYVCFTDNDKLESDVWNIRKAVSFSKHPRLNARYHKLHPHVYFSDYDFSLWVDGTHLPIIHPRELVEKYLGQWDIAMFPHRYNDCIYQEAKNCILKKKASRKLIKKQIEKYRQEKYPENNGLIESAVILRRHNSPLIIKTMNDWWEEIRNFSDRDQLSFNYVAYKNSLSYGTISGDVFENMYFINNPHQGKNASGLLKWFNPIIS